MEETNAFKSCNKKLYDVKDDALEADIIELRERFIKHMNNNFLSRLRLKHVVGDYRDRFPTKEELNFSFEFQDFREEVIKMLDELEKDYLNNPSGQKPWY